MELKGTKMNFIGDSITVGHTLENQEADVFWGVLGRETGAIVRGYGIGGTRIAKQLNETGDPIWHRYFGSRVDEMDADADVIVVFGGTNDYGHGDAPLGSFADRTPDTFYGACPTMMRSLIEKYPTAVIVVMTPIHRENDLAPKLAGVPLVTYVNIMKETAQYYGLPVLDLFACAGIQPSIPAQKKAFCPDGLHPNDAGNRRLADRLTAFLLAY